MALNLQNNLKRKWVKIGAITLVVYIIYKIVTGYFGPVPVRINVSNANVENIVVKFVVRGMVAPLKGGHELSRYTLHEETKLVKSNELIEFPKAYMWMAMEPVEYTIEVYHPVLDAVHKVVKLAELEDVDNIPITEINATLISELIDDAKEKYDNATPQQQKRIQRNTKSHIRKYHLTTKIQTRYIQAMKNAQKSPDEIYQQVKKFLVDCEKLFAAFNYGKECDIDEAFLKRAVGLVQK